MWIESIGPKSIVFILTAINILNFLDRGLIPGSTNEFDDFIRKCGILTNVDVFLGLLQSSFIVGYALASIVFGHMVHYYPPFKICALGMAIWVVAVVLCGLSYYSNSYVCLILSRMLSGVGEASFQCTIPPWIAKYSPPEERASWLSIFFTAIPVGTAAGYAYSASISESIGWQYAYFLEAALMLPFIPFLLILSPRYPTNNAHHDHKKSFDDKFHAVEDPNDDNSADVTPPTLFEELRALFSSPVFMCIVCGYAAQAGALIGVSTFGSSFLLGLGYFNSETEASSIFGALVCFAGLVCTPLGGWLLDRLTAQDKRRSSDDLVISVWGSTQEEVDLRAKRVALLMISIENFGGAALLCLVFFVTDKNLFLAMICVGCGSLFLSFSGISMALMLSIPVQHRSFGIAISSLCLHAFGDVPSPIIAGYIKDILAPQCAGSFGSTSAECRDHQGGLRMTLLIVSSWLFVAVLFFSIAWLVARCQAASQKTGHRLLSMDESYLIPPEEHDSYIFGSDPVSRNGSLEGPPTRMGLWSGGSVEASSSNSVVPLHRVGSRAPPAARPPESLDQLLQDPRLWGRLDDESVAE